MLPLWRFPCIYRLTATATYDPPTHTHTKTDRDIGKACTSMAELCGSDEACGLHVVTTSFRQLGGARGARSVCDVEAKVMIGALENSCFVSCCVSSGGQSESFCEIILPVPPWQNWFLIQATINQTKIIPLDVCTGPAPSPPIPEPSPEPASPTPSPAPPEP
jgi:hypothetical protein